MSAIVQHVPRLIRIRMKQIDKRETKIIVHDLGRLYGMCIFCRIVGTPNTNVLIEPKFLYYFNFYLVDLTCGTCRFRRRKLNGLFSSF